MSFDRNKVLESAQKFLAKGALDKAIAEFQKLVAADPKDVRTLLKIAELHARRGAMKDAVDTYLKVGDDYASQGFFTKSIAVYKQASKLDPTRIDALKKLAQNFEDLQHTADALATYEMLTHAYQSQGQMDGAFAAMKRATEIDPQNLAARIRYAEALSKANRPTEAAEEFEKGAKLIKQQGRIDDYIKVAERLLFHRENDLATARELAQLYLDRNDGKRALAKLQVLFKANPKDVGVLSMLARAFVSLEQRDKAVQVLKELAKIHFEHRRLDERAAVLKQVLALDPNDVEAKQALAGANRPRIDADAVVPASAVIGGGGRTGGTELLARRATMTGDAPLVPSPNQRAGGPVVPSPSNRGASGASPSPQPAPRPAAAPANVAAPLPANRAPKRPISEPPPLEIEIDEDVLIEEEASSPALDVASMTEAERESRVATMLAECEVFARYRLVDRILDQLERILEIAPSHRIAREKLRDVYLDQGRVDDAVEQMLAIAQLTKDADPAYALSQLKQAMLLDDENPDLRAAIRELDPSAGAARRQSMRPSRASLAPAEEDAVLFVDDEATEADEEAVVFVDAEAMSEPPPPLASSFAAGAPATAPQVPEPPRTAIAPSAPIPSEKSAQLPAVLAYFDDEEEEASPEALVALPEMPPEVEPVISRTPSNVDDLLGLGPSVPAMARPSAAVQTSLAPAPAARPIAAPIARTSVDDELPDLANERFSLVDVSMSAPPPPPAAVIESELDRPISREEFESAQVSEVAPPPRVSLRPVGAGAEEILDEADFYVAQGLFDEAREVLRDALAQHPNHPLLRDKLAEIDELDHGPLSTPKDIVAGMLGMFEEQHRIDVASFESPSAPVGLESPVAARESIPAPSFESPTFEPRDETLEEEPILAREAPITAPAPAPESPVITVPAPADEGNDEAFALAEKLAEALEEELGGEQTASLGADSIDVDQVFKQFKRGVEQQVDESDFETHYDLGIAYKEMGLLDDAIGEFELAARSRDRASIALTMIGLCRVEQGRVDEGIAALERGLAAPHRDAREELGLCFELGTALALAGRNDEALAYYERVRAAEPGFRGVNERITKLRNLIAAENPSDEDAEELERAFDDLIGE